MTDTRWQRAKEIFDEARRLAPDLRPSFINTACAGDVELQAEVEILLTSYKSDFMEDTALGAADLLMEPDLVPGQVIGRYRIGELIGTGGMGQVFRAEDTELDRSVAFKVLHGDIAENDERVRRFIQEAKAASALNHPNILTIHEIGSFESSRFMVSEYVDGETLRERMRSGLTSAESLDIVCQVAAALQAAHAAGIVHRDIKPENIMLRQDGLVKVLDFGLAKLTEADDQPIDANAPMSRLQTSPGLIMGTVAYMSPEQARGQTVDSRTDLWSLGVVFHEMLTGESTFKGESVTDLVTSILKHDPASLDLKAISEELKPICTKAIAKDKKARYQTAQELLQDLQGERKRMEYTIQTNPLISVSNSDELKTQLIRPRPTLSAEYLVTTIKRHKLATFVALVLVTFLGVGLSVYRYNGATPTPEVDGIVPLIDASTKEEDLKFSKLATSGRVLDVAISPDGNYLAYVTSTGSPATSSIRMLRRDTSNDTEIVSASNLGNLSFPSVNYGKLSFSPNGSYLYYRSSWASVKTVFRIPVEGGISTKITGDAASGVSLSPDAKSIIFDRVAGDVSQKIIVADADGSNERVLVQTEPQGVNIIEFGGVAAWAPDGKSFVGWKEFEDTGGRKYWKLISVSITDGARREVNDHQWSRINGVVYLANGNLVVAGKERSTDENGPAQLWILAPGSAPKRITNDSTGYSKVSGTKRGDQLITLQTRSLNDLWLLPENDLSRARPITSSGEISGGFSWMPNGKIVFSSKVSGNVDIWTMNADGTERKQLTSEFGQNTGPAVSSDGKYIVFMHNGTHIFRINADGTNKMQLTNGLRERNPRTSPDGKWVYYIQIVGENDPAQVRKVSIDGGDPSVLLTLSESGTLIGLDVSPLDGSIAYIRASYKVDHWKYELIIMSPNGGPPLKTIELPPTTMFNLAMRWTPDGKSIAFNDTRNGGANIWSISIDGPSVTKPLTSFTTPQTFGFNWSKDGKQLLVGRGSSSSEAVLISRKE